ncbi:hypothetical protein RIF29_41518 [Crotalaria pallida]|uniref:Glabrous enhancer-binding protein-like DBD domain-containing protein n=1 Tax=Crotalaria pallida TaxID=3830 RepID=A0AAN9HVD4_CROPI
MAKKQTKKPTSPVDDPPNASSSSSQDQQPDSSSSEDDDSPPNNKNQQQKQDEEEASSSEEEQESEDDEEEEEDDDDTEEQVEKTASKNPPSSNPKPPTSSETETESEAESPSASAFKIKPLASVPMDQSTPVSKPSKRHADANGHVIVAKRAKKNTKGKDSATTADASASNDDEEEEEVEGGKKSSAADSKNLPFQRIFSEEDDIAILKGMVEFQSNTGADPFKHVVAFCNFVKKSLSVEPTSNQLKQKIIRLKRKFEVNVGKGKNGKAPSFFKLHDREAFELSKKVWGNAANGVEKARSNGKAAKGALKKEGRGGRAKPKQEVKLLMDSKEDDDSIEVEEEEEGVKMDINQKPVIESRDYHVSFQSVVMQGMELVGATERKMFDIELEELQVAEFEQAVRYLELVANQARVAYEAFKSSKH